jgi:IMP dehydrogenase/GMP reductase
MQLDISTTSLCFDDILLVPKHSRVESRSDISIHSKLGNPNNPEAWIHLDIPVMTAPMEFINSNEMIEAVVSAGGMAFINKYQDDEKRFLQLSLLPENIKSSNRVGFGIDSYEAVDVDFINNALSCGVKTFVVDTALGHLQKVIDVIKTLRSLVPNNVHIMTGNVSSYEAYKDLMDAGADSVRVGIGGGAACTTRVVTGFGVPVLGSIMDVYENIKEDSVNGLISDGGIKENGDIVKALAAGASAIMMGSRFAGHDECERQDDGKFLFRGLASASIKLSLINGEMPDENLHHIEGVSGYVNGKGKVKNMLSQICDNIRSGMSYCGSKDLHSFKKDCRFIVVSSESLKESRSRI